MLRNNPIGSILVSVFFLLALTTFGLAWNWFFSTREFQAMEFRVLTIQATLENAQKLALTAIEYSKQNPDLDPVLIRLNLKTPPAAAPSASPPALRPSR